MRALPGWRRWLQAIIEPGSSPALEEVLQSHRQQVPVLWLIGKTGAGKSSVVHKLTGDSRAQIGSGFEPCTKSAAFYDHPQTAPVLRFLDTRGLGEANYDPAEDLAMAEQGSHAILLLTRADDPAQETVLAALRTLPEPIPIVHVHTALHTVAAHSLDRAIRFNHQQVIDCLQRDLPEVRIDFTEIDDGFDNPAYGIDELRQAIIDLVPELSTVLSQQHSSSHEDSMFLSVRKEVLGYAGAAAAVDLLPAIGTVVVPSLQGKMLHALAGRYALEWNRRMAGEFVAALGSSFLYRYLISLGTRQLLKFVPVYGQSAGAATAASISFASTYALGRAACLYFYRRYHDKPVDSELLRAAFTSAFKEQRK